MLYGCAIFWQFRGDVPSILNDLFWQVGKDDAYQKKLQENAKIAEEQTAKKRAKRLKKKQKAKQKKKSKQTSVQPDSESGNLFVQKFNLTYI